MVNVELHPHFTKCIKSFCIHLPSLSDLFLGGYKRNKTPPTNPILRKLVQFRVGAIPSEPYECICIRNIASCKYILKISYSQEGRNFTLFFIPITQIMYNNIYKQYVLTKFETYPLYSMYY